MAEHGIRKTRVIEIPSLSDSGLPTRVIRTEFMVGTDGPFAVEISARDFTAAKVREQMEKIAAELRQLPSEE